MKLEIFIGATVATFFLTVLLSRQGKGENQLKNAIQFMTYADKYFEKSAQIGAHKGWRRKTGLISNNKTKEMMNNATKKIDAAKKMAVNKGNMFLKAQKFPWKSFKGRNETLYRWFELLCLGLTPIAPPKDKQKYPGSRMSEIFNKAKICHYKAASDSCNLTLEDLRRVFGSSRDPEELKYYWEAVRKETGDKYRDAFIETIKFSNEEAKKLGYKNEGEHRNANYEDDNFVHNMALQFKKMLPLYRQMHAFVRKKLMKYYKKENIKHDGPIPAHLLGSIHAQKWHGIYPIVEPYPGSGGVPNITDCMHKKNMKVIDMFIMAENFFTSIGLKKMTPRFWRYSVIIKPQDRDIVCHASAHNFHDGKDFRIKMCARVDSTDFETVHHEMGHIQYYMHYSHLPHLFRASANPGFHEAIGDAISLSVMTPDYLSKVGLMKKNEFRKNKNSTINFLMNAALRFAVSPAYAYIIDHFRNKVFDGTIKNTQLNKKFWEYRLQFQGVCPPVERTEENFDFGAKFHVASNGEYFKYYVANILLFQIHKVLCEAAGHKGYLHECNIFQKKGAGKALAKLLSEGKSKKWQIILKSFSRKKLNKIDASAMLEYFKPLLIWLKKENAKEFIGWRSKDPMTCPGSKKSTSSHDTTSSHPTGSKRMGYDSTESVAVVSHTTESAISVHDTIESGTLVSDTTNSVTTFSDALL